MEITLVVICNNIYLKLISKIIALIQCSYLGVTWQFASSVFGRCAIGICCETWAWEWFSMFLVH